MTKTKTPVTLERGYPEGFIDFNTYVYKIIDGKKTLIRIEKFKPNNRLTDDLRKKIREG